MALRNEYYFRSVDRRWRKELRAASGRILIFSPFLTSGTAEAVLGCAAHAPCEVHTLFSAEVFASGASSVRTLKRLLARGLRLFAVPDLHAKIVVVGDRFASIGSQNLTSKGITNLEATVAVAHPPTVAEIAKDVKPWLERRTPITHEMLDEMERHLPALMKQARALRRNAAAVDAEMRRAAAHRARVAIAASVRATLQEMVGDGSVTEATAKKFVEETVWWMTHPSGPVPAPGFARWVYGSPGDWRLDLGGNTFLVGRAISRCRKAIESSINAALQGNAKPYAELVNQMKLIVRGAVANSRGEEYNGYYPVHSKDAMHFGAQAIGLDDFVDVFLQRLPELQHLLPTGARDDERVA